MGDGGVSWSVDEGFAPVEEQTFSFDDGESRSEILLAATKNTIVEVPSVYKQAGDGLSDLLNNGMEDKAEPQRTERVTLLNPTATGDGLVIKEEVGLRAV